MKYTLATLVLTSLLGLTACNQSSVTDDRDKDGVADLIDAFPDDATESVDTDHDGIGDNTDNDDDNDGTPDEADAFPTNRNEWSDSDSDGIGNNADLDDDNDGYEDTVDAFPVDASEWSDFDSDGIGNNADNDDDNDGVNDQYDLFPLNFQEHRDFDGDGIGDNADTDDDNDGQEDITDTIDMIGNHTTYQQNEFISLKVRGFNPERQALDAENGWHLQYTVYNAETNQRITSLSSEGYYNGQWDNQQQSWRVYFPAPVEQIEYKTTISVYCSLISYDCEGIENNFYQIEDEFNFSVYCEDEDNCIATNLPHKATQITDSLDSQNSPVIQKSPQGELLVTYRDFADLSMTPIMASIDDGSSWQARQSLPRSHYKTFQAFNDGTLAVLQYCDMTICIYQKHPNGEEHILSLQTLIEDADLDISLLTDSEGSHFPFAHFTLFQSSDNGYIVGFTVTRSLTGIVDDLYLIKTFDFVEADTVTKLNSTSGGHGHLSIAESAANITVTYSRLDESYHRTWVVQQGADLMSLQTVATTPSRIQDLDVITVNGTTRIIGNLNDSLYEMQVEGNTLVSSTLLYNGGIQLGFSALALGNNEVAIVYEADWNEQRDIFMDRFSFPE